ncbi:MAG: hypothetical protein M3227_01545 [Thermoproteota archaeon]|nr:hypothetical protein [Thermoproteota archaeon]
MTSNKNSLQEKKLYLKQMSQHFKEMADKQTNQIQRVIANTFSKNADIMEDLYSQIEELSIQLTNAKSEIQQLRSNMSGQLSEIKQNAEKREE